MLLRINPNRMELIRLRKRLILAQRGHKLLQDKLEEMMRRFMNLLRDIDEARQDFQTKNHTIIQNLLYCRITTSKKDFEESLSKINSKINIEVLTAKVMNIQVPIFNIKELYIEKEYDFFKTSAQMDLVIVQAKDYIISFLKAAQFLKALDILSYEIERTRRRVNALEYVLIPSIQVTIKYITQKLNEFERGNLIRLMRITEVVRTH